MPQIDFSYISSNCHHERIKRAGKRVKQTVRQSPPPSPPTKKFILEPNVPTNPYEKSPILIGKNINFFKFTIEAPAFHIKEYFKRMGWVFVATMKSMHTNVP